MLSREQEAMSAAGIELKIVRRCEGVLKGEVELFTVPEQLFSLKVEAGCERW